jgi:hypothetical protein
MDFYLLWMSIYSPRNDKFFMVGWKNRHELEEQQGSCLAISWCKGKVNGKHEIHHCSIYAKGRSNFANEMEDGRSGAPLTAVLLRHPVQC